MDLDTQIDPSPLITRKFSSRLSSIGVECEHDIEQSSITLTDFQRTSSDAPISANSSGSTIWRERILHPCKSTKIYFSDLSSVFTWRFLSWLAIQNFAMYGGVSALIMSVSLPLFKEMGIDASRQQLYSTMTLSPFALKPFIGVTSDLFPIKGYHKRYLALLSILIGLIGCSALLALYHNRNAKAAAQDPETAYRLSDLLVICFFCMNVTAANLDILGEGKYSEIMRKNPESGSSVITFKFACSLLGSIVTNSYVGPLTDGGHFHIIFCIALGLLLTPFYPTLRGWLPEKKRRKSDPGMTKICCGCLFDQGSFQKKRTPFIVIALSGLAVPLLSSVTTFASLGIGIAVSMVVLLLLAGVTYAVFPRVVFRIVVAIMLIKISHIKLGSVLGYFYTADETCLPDGPHFSYTYYITIAGIVGSMVNLIAVLLYQSYLSSCRFRPALMCTILAGAMAPIMDIILVKRWNHALGISDKVFFILGSAIFEHFVNIVVALPMMVLFGKLAPPGMESAVFSYAVGIATFCFMMSQLFGSAIIKWSTMKTVGTDCNFDELPAIIGVCQILLPIIVGLPATLLIPNRLQTEPLIDWEKERWYEDDERDENITELLHVFWKSHQSRKRGSALRRWQMNIFVHDF